MNTDNKVIIITARSNFDDKEVFLNTFRKYNFDIDRVRVERAGNITDISNPAMKKYIIIHNYLKVNQYNKVRLFDDAMNNLTEFLKLKTIFPEIEFEANFAKQDGSIQII